MDKNERKKVLARLSLDLDRLTGKGYVLRFCKAVDSVNDNIPADFLDKLDALHDKFVEDIEKELAELQEPEV